MSTILCVDDEGIQLSTRKRILEAAGYDVVAVRDPAEAMDVLYARRIDLVFVDYRLEGITAESLIEDMRLFRRDLPIVILSGTDLEVSAETRALATDFWIKGHQSPQEWLKKVKVLLNDRRAA